MTEEKALLAKTKKAVIASEAKQSMDSNCMDCHVASLLAMTGKKALLAMTGKKALLAMTGKKRLLAMTGKKARLAVTKKAVIASEARQSMTPAVIVMTQSSDLNS